MTRALRLMKASLWGVLVFCVGLRLMAWLIAPALPIVAVLFAFIAILVFVAAQVFGR